MSAINPVPNIRPPMQPAQAGLNAPRTPAATGGDFGKMLSDYVSNVDGAQHDSGQAIRDLIAGKSENVLPVVAQVARADMSFKLLIGVRNKVIEAYKQTMNMQV